MQLQELHMLVVLSEELNMRKASERLFVSQPALSQRLQTIERVGNQNLFSFTKRLDSHFSWRTDYSIRQRGHD